MRLTVIGCGKMGLPIAVQAASRGVEVIGVDSKPATVEAINAGRSPINEPSVEPQLVAAVNAGRLKADTDIVGSVSNADAVIVIVPVLLTQEKRADLSIILDVTEKITKAMNSGTLVSYETTVPVGTTTNVFKPILEQSGMTAEKDFYLVYSPERVKSCFVMENLNRISKVLGGVGPLSAKKGYELYQTILQADVIDVGSTEKAEMVKIAGMVYRDVNIALVNEMARYCDQIGINLCELIPVINSNGEASMLHPGIGVGGHCTPVYPYFLINEAEGVGAPQLLAEKARIINDTQADYIASRLEQCIGNLSGIKILILGLGFRPDVKEDTESSAYLVSQHLESKKAEVFLYDPLYSEFEIREKGFSAGDLYGSEPFDALILVTAHNDFLQLDWEKMKRKNIKIVVDGRNCLNRNLIEGKQIVYIGIGQGDVLLCNTSS